MSKKTIKITLNELQDLIIDAIRENKNLKKGKVLNEGVKYDADNDSFIFNFEMDNEADIIQLQKIGYQISAFNQCYYYAYEFAEGTTSSDRGAFIHSLKFPDGKISQKDKRTFIVNGVNKLDSDISLPSFKLVVYPESMSELNREMLGYLNRFASPDLISMEIVKELPSRIEFDYERFKVEILDSKLENGRFRYTEKQKEEVLGNIQTMMDRIHHLDYFSIARDVNKSKYRPFIRNYYVFKNEEDRKLFEKITKTNVLVIDDIVTSGTTISHILNSLRSVNDTNKIVVFSLIGKNL